MYRRQFVVGSLAAGIGMVPALLRDRTAQAQTPVAPAAQPAAPKKSLTARRFDRNWLRGQAEMLAKRPYVEPRKSLPPALEKLDYDGFRKLRFNGANALWAKDNLGFTAQFFHLGFLYKTPVHIFQVSDGIAEPVPYSPAMFDFGQAPPEGLDIPDLGFAGFRLHSPINRPDYLDEIAAFLGASYFRCVARTQRYGQSARGIAINTATPKGEEFPRFTSFWIEKPQPGAGSIVVHALLDGPSLSGAYSFRIIPGRSAVVDVDVVLFPRKEVEKLGLAPLSSMHYFGKNDRIVADDFRPEVHDSDGLSIWTGAGEWIWRPIVNPSRLRISSFRDRTPRGFGLLQRERHFSSYEDSEARYDLRPSVWIEPRGDWGAGAVELIEIPTPDETNDNIVAFWVPEIPAKPGTPLTFSYRMHWCMEPPVGPEAARVVSTRTGLPGYAGAPRPQRGRKFVVTFEGGLLGNLRATDPVEAVVSTSSGTIGTIVAEPMPELARWRAVFDVIAGGDGPIELRSFLRFGQSALTETWSYQWTP